MTSACETCKKFVQTTLSYRDMPYNELIVKDLLVGVCDICDNVTVIPHQSVPQIHKAIKENEI